jgi:hypothetical protein
MTHRMHFFNMTPHGICVIKNGATYLNLPIPVGLVRLDFQMSEQTMTELPNGPCLPVYTTSYSGESVVSFEPRCDDVTVMPGDAFIVSSIVGSSGAAPGLTNKYGVYVFSPGPAARRHSTTAPSGRVYHGCYGLRLWSSP